jgi:hypothetical protein
MQMLNSTMTNYYQLDHFQYINLNPKKSHKKKYQLYTYIMHPLYNHIIPINRKLFIICRSTQVELSSSCINFEEVILLLLLLLILVLLELESP